MSLARDPVAHDARLEIATNQLQHSLVRDSLLELSHQHVVVHPVEKLLQVHVHHPPLPALDVLLRRAHGIVCVASRPKTVAVLREARVESRLQHIQNELLDKAIEHRRDAKLAHPAVLLRYLVLAHRRRLIRPLKKLLAQLLPVRLQMRRQLVHRHPVDAGTALVLLHSRVRRLGVVATDHLFHEAVRSRAFVSTRRRRRFAASLCSRGCTPTPQREPQLPGLLAPFVFEAHGRLALPSVRPFTASESSYFGSSPLRLARRYYGLC